MALGDWTGALADLDRAVSLMPADAEAHYARARCLLRLDRKGDAESGLRRTIELDASNPAPLNTLVQLLIRSGRAKEARPLAEKAVELGRQQRSAGAGEIRFRSYRADGK